ncbi:putative uncharacterized protein DDB_G0287457 [Oppia nitens]|uniref:putative uncharacterized protein DDB_G0287457 n=1 Tax=Oppia nitens TaxID=1686743 RepID=UPI0023DA0024|nr:putative uncharacterized protein DDB_G0287457 [Oppia nitens]
MYRLCSYKIYFHIISVLIVCGQEFDSQISASNAYIHRRPIGSNNIQPIHKHQQHRNHNVVLNRGTAAHPTISSRPEFTSERPNRDRESHHSRRDTRHLTHPQWRQQMPYNTNDDNIKSFNDKHQMLSHNSYQQHQQKRSPIHQKPQRKQKPSQVANRKTFNDYDFQLQNTRYPEIVENERHLRIQPPFSRDEEFGQNHGIDSLEEHNLRHFVPNSDYPDEEHHNIQQDDNLDVDNMIANPEMHFMNQIQNNFNHQYRRPNAEIIGHNNERPESSNLGLKTVLPKNRDKNRIESNMRSFEAFSSDINHEENDKQFPNYNLNEQQFVPSNHQSLPEEQTEEYFNSPETDDHNNDNQYQTNHNYFPPLNTNEEESQKIPAKYQTNKENNLHFFGDRFKQSDPKNFYNNRQHKQNKANQQNIQNYGQQKTTTFSRSFNNPYESINRNHQFVPFYENYHNLHSNNIQKTTKRPNNLKGKPIKKEIAIVREITEIIPQNADNHHLLNDDQFDDTISIATPSPPKLPNIFMSFDEENDQKLVQQPDLGKDEHFYDDEEYMILDFAKEVDLSADELEKYFDKEFIVEQEKNEDGTNQQVVFDDEPKESNQEVSKKDTEKTNEKIDENNDDMELEYKSSDDFHKNHENFLQNIEKENEKFRQRTDDKLTETDSDEIELDQTNNTTNVESDVEKELDSNSEIKDNNDSEEDKQKSDNNNNDSNEQNNNNNGVNDNDNKDSKSGTNDTEDDEESESKQVSEKEEIKEEKTEELKEESKEEHSDDEKNNNKQNSEQTEEDKEKNDKQNIDNKENEETTNDDKSDDEKVDEDKSDDKEDKELLKEESKESKNELIKSKRGVNEEQEDNRGQESVAKHTAEKLIGGSNGDLNDKTLVEMKPNKLNKTLRISQNHNFAPVFIDLKRINPNLKITTGVKNGETEHTTHWPTTSATDIKSGISSQSAIDEHKAQYTMNSESKPAITGKNHTTTGLSNSQ